MFRRLDHRAAPSVTLTFEGRKIEAQQGDTVAAALLSEQETTFRTTSVSGRPRGPLCMMGVCFDCLLSIDGEDNKQGCQVLVRDGMVVQRQSGPPKPPVEGADG